MENSSTGNEEAPFLVLDASSEAGREARLKSDFYRAILNNSLVGIVLLNKRRFVHVNKKMADIFGYASPEEMIGKYTKILYRSEEENENIGKNAYSTLAEGKEYKLEFIGKKKDGQEFWCVLTGKAVNPEEMDSADSDSVWIYQDINEQKKQEFYLKSDVYRTILNNSLVGIVLLNKRRFVQANQKMADIFGYASPEEMIGKYTKILYRSEEDYEAIGNEGYSTLAEGKEYKLEFIGKKKDGQEFWCVLTGKAVNPEEMVDADSVWIFQDIDEQKKQELYLKSDVYRAILNNSLVGIVLLSKRRINHANQKMADIFGYASPEEMIGKYTKILYRSEEENENIGKNAYSTLAEGKEYKLEFIGKKKDGQEFWCVLTGKAVNPEEMVDADSVWIFQDIDEQKKQEIQLERFAYYDTLTGLPNRRMFEEHIKNALARTERSRSLMAVCFMDLDGFKGVNDNYGHDAGDVVLVEVSRRISGSLRKTDVITRLGGDEFILLLENINGKKYLEDVLSRIESLVKTPVFIGHHKTVNVGVSMGACLYDGATKEDYVTILNNADKAMYSSKAAKSNRKFPWTVCGF